MPSRSWTTLGHPKFMNHPMFPYSWVHLWFIKTWLTTVWTNIQTGTDVATLDTWQCIFVYLGLDRKAIVDMMLLAHSGEPGRAEANEIM